MDSFIILGCWLWLNVRMSMLWPEYFWMMRLVSSSVLNEFMRMKGTSQSWLLLRYSIWRTVRSRKLSPSRTSIALVAEASSGGFKVQTLATKSSTTPFGTNTAHGCSKTAVQLEHNKLLQQTLLPIRRARLKR